MRTGACLWAFSLLLGLGAAGSVAPPPAAAQQTEAQAFEIAPQPLSSALLAFAEQTGLEVLFDARIAQGKTSPGVQGSYAPEQALRRLLAGSGLRYRFTSASTITLERDAAQEDEGPIRLAPVTVTGERVERTIAETASSVAVITGDDLEDRPGDQTITDAVADIPNVFDRGGLGTGPVIRGQNSLGPAESGTAFFGGSVPRASYIVDGRVLTFNEFVYGTSSAWDVERIEVFRGPQTTAQGANSIAGAFYIYTKDPTFTPEATFHAEGGNFERRRAAAVLSGPIVDEELAGRVAFDYQFQDTFVDYTNPAFDPGAASTDIELIDARAKLLWLPSSVPALEAKLTVKYSDNSAPQSETLTEPIDDLEDRDSIAIPSFETKSTGVILDTIYDFSEYFTLANQFQYSDVEMERFLEPPERGAASEDSQDIANEIRLNFDAIEDKLSGVTGVYFRHQHSDQAISFIGDSSFEDERTGVGFFGELTYDLTDRLTVLSGLRYQRDSFERIGSVGTFGIGDVSFDKTFDEILPRLSVSYDITDDVALGVLVSRGYNPGGVALSFTRDQFVEYDAETLWNYELFTRISLLGGRLFVNSNLFYTDIQDAQRFVRVNDPGAPNGQDTFIVNAEEARTYGLELSADFRATGQLRIFGAVGLLQTDFREFNDAADDFVGNEFANAPNYSLTLGAKWEPITNVSLGVRIRHTDGAFSDDLNTADFKTDPATIVDFDLAYEPIESVTVFGYVNNAFNEIEALSRNQIGANAITTTRPREYGVGLRVSF